MSTAQTSTATATKKAEKKPPGKILVRGIPDNVLQALHSVAAKNERSAEAQVRLLIAARVEPQLRSEQRSARAKIIGQRIQYLLEELGDLREGKPTGPISPSRIAEALGWSYAEPLESWTAGETEPSFQELSQIATVTGCDNNWLTHGEGVPFPFAHWSVQRSVRDAVMSLLYPFNISGPSPRQLMIIRNESKNGELAFVVQYSDWQAQAYATPHQFAGANTRSGKVDLAFLALVFECLCLGEFPLNVVITGHQVSAEHYRSLIEGRSHPVNIMRSSDIVQSTWWKDIWDSSVIKSGDEYWPGYRALAESIFSEFEDSPRLQTERKALRTPGFIDPGERHA